MNESGEVESPEAKYFKAWAELYGMKKTDLNKVVNIQGRDFKITGLKQRGMNQIVGMEIKTSKSFKLPLDLVKKSLNNN